MPLFNPPGISTALPIKIGGAPSAGGGSLASAFNHVHPFTETAGPTNLDIGAILVNEVVARAGAGSSLIGRLVSAVRVPASSTINNTTTLTDILSFPVGKAGSYVVFCLVASDTGNATTGIQFAFTFSGTAGSIRCGIFGGTGAAVQSNAAANGFGQLLGSATVGPGPSSVLSIVMCSFVATSAGTLALRFASGVAGSNAVIRQGTFCVLMEA